MITSFEVGALFTIQDEASGVLSRLSEQMTILSDRTKATAASMQEIGRVSLARLNTQVGELVGHLNAAATAAERFQAAMAGAAATAGASAAAAAASAAAAAAAVQGAATAATQAAQASRMLALPAPQAPLMLPAPGGGGRGGFTPTPWAAAGGGGAVPPGALPGAAGGAGGPPGGIPIGSPGTPPAVPVPIRRGGLLSGTAPLGTVLYGGYSAYKAMDEERAIAQSLITMGYKPGEPGYAEAYQRMMDIAYESHRGQIYSEAQVAHVLPGMAGVLGSVAGDTKEDKLAMMGAIAPTAIRMGEVAEQEGLGGLGPSTLAAFQYAHMTRRYTPETLGPGLDMLLNLSRVTHQTVPAEQNILKYGVPLGMAAGMSPDEAAKWIGFLQIMGFSGTTAATGFGQIIMGMTATGGPLAAHVGRVRRAGSDFEHALNLQPGTLSSAHSGAHKDDKHVDAMKRLGLLNAQGKWADDVAPGGNLSGDALMEHISKFAATHKPEQVLGTLRDAFTVRGMRPAGIMDPDALDRGFMFFRNVGKMPGAADTQTMLQSTTMQQMEQVFANFLTTGTILTSKTLPALQAAFERLNTVLNSVNDFLRDHPKVAEAGGWGVLGLAAGALIGGGRAAWHMIRHGLHGGAQSAATGAGAGMARVPLMRLGIAGLATYGLGEALEAGSDWLEGRLFGGERVEERKRLQGVGETQVGNWFRRLLGIPISKDDGARLPRPSELREGRVAGSVDDPNIPTVTVTAQRDRPSAWREGATGAVAASGAAASGGVHITVGPITLNGVSENMRQMVEELFRNMAGRLTEALTHASGSADGSHNSPYLGIGGMQ